MSPTTPTLRGDLLALILPAAAAVGLAVTGAAAMAGAHPFWAGQVFLLGAPAGAALFLGLRWLGLSLPWMIGLGLGGTAAAYALAALGKARFAASFAEDTLAGRLWHFGWIGVAAAGTLLLAALVRRR